MFCQPSTAQPPQKNGVLIIFGFFLIFIDMTEQKPLVLLIDDEQEFREILCTKLRASGFNMVEAVNGEEGIRKIKEIKPDLVLLDLKMPVMNGAEAILEIKSDPAIKNFKVVFLTNYGEAQKEMVGLNEKFAKEVGAFSYIRKTDDLDGIVERIKNIFRASATNNSGNR